MICETLHSGALFKSKVPKPAATVANDDIKRSHHPSQALLLKPTQRKQAASCPPIILIVLHSTPAGSA